MITYLTWNQLYIYTGIYNKHNQNNQNEHFQDVNN